jgi:hypothetical protein
MFTHAHRWIVTAHFFKIHFNIILHLCQGFQCCLSLSGFRPIFYTRCFKRALQFESLYKSIERIYTKSKSKSKLLYDWRAVSQYVLVSGTPLGPMIRFYFFLLFCRKIYLFFLLGRSLWRVVVQSVSGQSRWGLITIHYCFIWDYWVSFPSPLTTCRDYGGSILTRIHTGKIYTVFWTVIMYQITPRFTWDQGRRVHGCGGSIASL